MANAGIASYGSVLQVDPEAFQTSIDVNIIGVFNTVRAALPAVIDRRGYVLIVSSLAAFAAAPGLAPYNASKAARRTLRQRAATGGRPPRSGRRVGAHVVDRHPAGAATPRRTCRAFGEMLTRCHGPLGKTTSVEACGDAFVKGIEGRKR